LVVWNMNIIFPYIGNNHHVHIFQRGWNHQPEKMWMYQGNMNTT
jgi:hypothetical protein